MTLPFVPVADLLAVGRPDDMAVAVHEGQERSWSEFVARTRALSHVLEGASAPRWALYTESAWAFSIGLVGIWQAGGIAVVPPNGQPGTLKELSANVRAVVTDRRDMVGAGDAVSVLDIPLAPPGAMRRLDPDGARLELYTSGTTGAPTVVVKSVGQLDREVAIHEARWGELIAGARVVATVSHQHIYGLLFRVVWPLAAGRVFLGDAFLHPAEVAAAVAGIPRACLVSTPAHLRRLEKSPSALERVRSTGTAVFSSGGPLDTQTAHALDVALGAPPIEIFGSTETGGVAWRRQQTPPALWTPFEGVKTSLSPDGRLQVQSPWIGPEGPVTMGDQAQFHDGGRFALGPRADRTVKIGEKRLALSEMEMRLGEHPFVGTSVVLAVEQHGEARLAAVVVPSREGLVVLHRDGARHLSGTLRRWLDPHWDRVLLPRLWRFVDRLPEDSQGKTTVAALRALFEPSRDAR